MTHTKNISRELPAKATFGLINKGMATVLPNWPGTIIDVWNLLWYAIVVTPASTFFGFTKPTL